MLWGDGRALCELAIPPPRQWTNTFKVHVGGSEVSTACSPVCVGPENSQGNASHLSGNF